MWIILVCVCLSLYTSAYYIKKIITIPPKAKFGYNSQFVQHDEYTIGNVFF